MRNRRSSDDLEEVPTWGSYNSGAESRRLQPFSKLKPTKSNVVRAARQCLPLAQLCLGCNASGCIFVTIVGVLLLTQAEYVAHIVLPAESAVQCFTAAAVFFALAVVCLACVIIVCLAERQGTLSARLAGYGSINRHAGPDPDEDAPLLARRS